MTKQRLLVVEDNTNLIHMIKEYCKTSSGIEVTCEAHDGKEAFVVANDNINNHDESTSVVSDNYNNGPIIDINSNQSINSNQDNNPNSELIKLGLELYEKQIKEIDNNKKD